MVEGSSGFAVMVGSALVLLALYLPGFQLRYRQKYEWVPGYNSAPEERQREYDIQGLAHHIGNGLMTVGVMQFFAAGAWSLDWRSWFWWLVGGTAFVVLLMARDARLWEKRFP